METPEKKSKKSRYQFLRARIVTTPAPVVSAAENTMPIRSPGASNKSATVELGVIDCTVCAVPLQLIDAAAQSGVVPDAGVAVLVAFTSVAVNVPPWAKSGT